MIRTFKNWLAQERAGRVEKDTSQDMCPTNGDALTLFCIMLMVGCIVLFAGLSN